MNQKTKFIHRPRVGLTKSSRCLTARQLAVIDEVFRGELDEQAVLDKYKVSRRLYNKWLADSSFTGEFDRRIESAYRQSVILIVRYAPLAAAKLVGLISSDKEETVRKVCLDILSMNTGREATDDGRQTRDEGRGGELSDQAASRLLSILAEGSTEKEPP